MGGGEPCGYFLWVPWVPWVPRAAPVLSSNGEMDEGQLLNTYSSRLWGRALGTRLYQGMSRLPAWRCLP